jgi:hypothetical protein
VKTGARDSKKFWTPAFAGVTALGIFYEAIKDGYCSKEDFLREFYVVTRGIFRVLCGYR